MASEFDQFAGRMERRATDLARRSHILLQVVALRLAVNVIRATPVDTGEARSNWVASVGRQDRSRRGPYAPGSKLGLGESANAAAAIAQNTRTIRSSLPGQSLYVQNNAPHIGELNRGKSTQAPALFVQTGIQEAVSATLGRGLIVR